MDNRSLDFKSKRYLSFFYSFNVKTPAFLFVLFIAFACTQKEKSADYPIQPVPFSNVKITDTFWSKKIKTNHEVTIPIAYQKSLETGRIDNFKKAAGLMPGPFATEYPFDDSDVFKIIEAASYSVQVYPDATMESMMDSLIYYIAMAQEPDGYLYTTRTIKEGSPHPWAGKERWELVNELSHELYNLGHMYEAAAAHHTATGKRTFLDVAIKSADLVCDTFGPGKIENYPGHQEIEIGLVKLYRITQNKRYLDMAKYFLDARGKEGIGRPDKYNQSHVPVTDQKEAVGHSVRAAYMWTAMADVAAITGDDAYVNAINTLWHDVVDTKYYINGGIGSTSSHEGFGAPYELPNMTAYNETCAGVGNAMWNHRMFLMTGDSKYMDILERTMFNNILTGVSQKGDTFFYPNPLSSVGQHERSEWFGCACCPPNVARFLPSMPGYIYATEGDNLFVNLYISNESTFEMPDGDLIVKQESSLPWEGKVTLTFQNDQSVLSNLKLRIPGWARNKPVPGQLYAYSQAPTTGTRIKVNGDDQVTEMDAMGYVSLAGNWKAGDTIEIEFPFDIKIVKARDEVLEDRGKVAIERGPILYCAEWPDNGSVQNLVLSEGANFEAVLDNNLLEGIVAIQTTARKASRELDGSLTLSEEVPLKLIPYHLWNNRGPGEMVIWLPTTLESTRPAPAPTKVYKSTITASGNSKLVFAVADQDLPQNTNDRTFPVFHWWPKKDSWEWVQFDFPVVQDISKVQVYWFADTPDGGTALPDEWEVEYSATVAKGENTIWKTVRSKTPYPVNTNDWSTVSFAPVRAGSLRLKVKLNEKFAAGIHEVIIE